MFQTEFINNSVIVLSCLCVIVDKFQGFEYE